MGRAQGIAAWFHVKVECGTHAPSPRPGRHRLCFVPLEQRVARRMRPYPADLAGDKSCQSPLQSCTCRFDPSLPPTGSLPRTTPAHPDHPPHLIHVYTYM